MGASNHCLHQLLPPFKSIPMQLRDYRCLYELPVCHYNLYKRSFVLRNLFLSAYWLFIDLLCYVYCVLLCCLLTVFLFYNFLMALVRLSLNSSLSLSLSLSHSPTRNSRASSSTVFSFSRVRYSTSDRRKVSFRRCRTCGRDSLQLSLLTTINLPCLRCFRQLTRYSSSVVDGKIASFSAGSCWCGVIWTWKYQRHAAAYDGTDSASDASAR